MNLSTSLVAPSSIVTAIAALTLITGCGKKQQPLPEAHGIPFSPAPVVPAFSGQRAFTLLERQVELGPRVPGSDAHTECRNFMVAFLKPLADTVREQTFTVTGTNGLPMQLTNVIARFNKNAATRILLCAHWDSRPRADRETDPKKKDLPIPGANDGASGVGVLLHMAELFKQAAPTAGVDLVFFDGEDYGTEGDAASYCLGSKFFAANIEPDDHPLFGILLDLVGDKDAVFPQEGHSLQYAPDVLKLVWSTAQSLGVPNFQVVQHDPIIDDHTPLNTTAGIRTIDIIDADLVGQAAADPRRKYWHTLEDTPDKCSAQTLERVGKVLMQVVYGIRPAS